MDLYLSKLKGIQLYCLLRVDFTITDTYTYGFANAQNGKLNVFSEPLIPLQFQKSLRIAEKNQLMLFHSLFYRYPFSTLTLHPPASILRLNTFGEKTFLRKSSSILQTP